LSQQQTNKQNPLKKKKMLSAVAQAFNPSFVEGWDQEACSSRPALAKSWQDPYFD
jgi:hypothetical protein